MTYLKRAQARPAERPRRSARHGRDASGHRAMPSGSRAARGRRQGGPGIHRRPRAARHHVLPLEAEGGRRSGARPHREADGGKPGQTAGREEGAGGRRWDARVGRAAAVAAESWTCHQASCALRAPLSSPVSSSRRTSPASAQAAKPVTPGRAGPASREGKPARREARRGARVRRAVKQADAAAPGEPAGSTRIPLYEKALKLNPSWAEGWWSARPQQLRARSVRAGTRCVPARARPAAAERPRVDVQGLVRVPAEELRHGVDRPRCKGGRSGSRTASS